MMSCLAGEREFLQLERQSHKSTIHPKKKGIFVKLMMLINRLLHSAPSEIFHQSVSLLGEHALLILYYVKYLTILNTSEFNRRNRRR